MRTPAVSVRATPAGTNSSGSPLVGRRFAEVFLNIVKLAAVGNRFSIPGTRMAGRQRGSWILFFG
jgi:hypothetical protein